MTEPQPDAMPPNAQPTTPDTHEGIHRGRNTSSWTYRHGLALSNILLVLGALFLLLSALFVWANQTFFSSGGFSDAATDAVHNDAVQQRLAQRLTDRILANDPQRQQARPLVEGAASAVIQSQPFEPILKNAIVRVHERLFDEHQSQIVVDLTAALPRIFAIIQFAAPELAARIPANLESGVITLSQSDFRAKLVEWSDRVSFLAFVLPVLSFAAFAGSLYFARDRARGVFRLGLALAIVAVVLLLALAIGNYVLKENVRNAANGPAASGIYWAFADSLREAMRIVAVIGIVLAAAGWWVARRGLPARLSHPRTTAPQP